MRRIALFFTFLSLLSAVLPAEAASFKSSVIFTNLDRRQFIVDLTAAPTNMVKLKLSTTQFDTGGDTIIITNISGVTGSTNIFFNNIYATNLYVTNLFAEFSYISNLFVTNITAFGPTIFNGKVTINTNVTINGLLSVTNLTPNTIVKADSNTNLASVANGTGALTNDGAGNFGWYPLSASGGDTIWTNDLTLTTLLPGKGASVVLGANAGPWWFPNASDGFTVVHDQSVGESDATYIYAAAVDDAFAPTNNADFRITLSSTAQAAAQLNMAAETNGVTSRFNVSLQPDAGVSTIVLENQGATKFAVASDSLFSGTGTLFLSDDGTYKSAGGSGDTIWTNNAGVIEPLGGQTTNVLRFTSGLANNATNVAMILKSADVWDYNATLLKAQNGDNTLLEYFAGGSLYLRGNTNQNNTLLDLTQIAENRNIISASSAWGGNVFSLYGLGGVYIASQETTGNAVLYIDGCALGGNSPIIEAYSKDCDRILLVNHLGKYEFSSGVASGTLPFSFNTLASHSSGNLAEVKNNATNKFTVVWDGSITTGGNTNRWIFKDVVEAATTNLTVNVNTKDYVITLGGGGGGGTTINPTDLYIPYRSNATTFADSPIWVAPSGDTMVDGAIDVGGSGTSQFSGPVEFLDTVSITNLTPNTIVKVDANTNLASVATGTGALTNDGAGNFGWFDLSLISGGATINPTDNYLPVRTSATTFGDSLIWQTNSIALLSAGVGSGASSAYTGTSNIFNIGLNAGNGQELTNSSGIFNIGDGSGILMLSSNAYGIYNIGTNVADGCYFEESENIFSFGVDGPEAGSFRDTRNVFGFGADVFWQIDTGTAANLLGLGFAAGESASVFDSSHLVFIGSAAGFSGYFQDAMYNYFIGHNAGYNILSQGQDIYVLGGGLQNATLGSSTRRLFAIGGTPGASINGSYTNVMLIGDGATVGATALNQVVFGPSMSLLVPGDIQMTSATVTNNIGALLSAGDTTFVDMLKASQTNALTAALTFAHATNGVAGVEYTHVRTFMNGNGADYLVTLPAAWINPDGASFTLTNNGIVKLYVNSMGPTADAASQTNVISQIKFCK